MTQPVCTSSDREPEPYGPEVVEDRAQVQCGRPEVSTSMYKLPTTLG